MMSLEQMQARRDQSIGSSADQALWEIAMLLRKMEDRFGMPLNAPVSLEGPQHLAIQPPPPPLPANDPGRPGNGHSKQQKKFGLRK